MPSALLDRVDHYQLLSALGVSTIRTLPAVSKCPLCQTQSSLEITRGLNGRPIYRCRDPHCDFLGDGVTLFQAVSGISDVYDTCLQLLSEGVVHHVEGFQSEVESYLAARAAYHNIDLAFWHQCQANFSGRNSLVAALLQQHGAYAEGIWESGIHRHIGCCTGRWVKEHYTPRQGTKNWIKVEDEYLVMPLWGDMLTIVGYLLVNQWSEYEILPARNLQMGDTGLGFLHTCYPNDDLMLICTCPFEALRVFSRGLVSGDRIGMVYAHLSSNTFRTCPVRQHLLLNPEDKPSYHKMALRIPECRVATAEDVQKASATGFEPMQTEIDLLHECSQTVYQAIARRLSRLQSHEALSEIDHLSLDSSEVIKVLGSCPPEAKDRLASMLKGRMQSRSVALGRDSVVCSPEGWLSDRVGLISNTMFFIDTLIYDQHSGQIEAEGTITQGDNQYPFRTPFETLRKKTEQWLLDTVIKNRGQVPIIANGWKNKLWPISQLFRNPRTIYTANASGWVNDNQRLLLPNIVIEHGAIYENTGAEIDDAAGAMLSVPRDLEAQHFKDLCYDDESGGVFWGLFTAIAANILAPFHGLGTAGIAVVGSPEGVLGQLVAQADREVGFESLNFQTASKRQAQQARKTEARSPFPVLVREAWNNSEGFRSWLQAGEDRNCLVEMSKDVAIATSLSGGWYYVSSQAVGDGWRRFETLWRTLPLFIAWVQSNAVEWPTSRSELVNKLLMVVEQWLGCSGHDGRAVLNRAERIFTVDVIDRHTVWGVRFINFVIEATETGLMRLNNGGSAAIDQSVTIDARGRVVFVPAQLVGNLMRDLGITPPAHKQVCQSLEDIGVLTGKTYQNISGYAIDRDQYNMYWSLRALPAT